MSPSSYAGTELEVFAGAHRWKAYWAEFLRPFLGRRVLEVGAGLGANTAALRHSAVRRWTCLEPDLSLARRIERARLSEDGGCCWVVAGTISAVSPHAFFDTIVFLDVLEHVSDDRAQLEEARLRMAPGGALVVLAPAHQFLYSPFDRAIGHYRRYDVTRLRSVVPPDLRERLLVYLDAAGLLLSLGNRLLLRSSSPTARQIAFWDRAVVPVSRRVDRWFGYRVGKSILGVWLSGNAPSHPVTLS